MSMASTGASAKRKRVYEEWQGNEQFFCWGYLVAGPNWRASIGSALLLLAPTGIFLGFVAPYVAARTHAVIMAFSVILPFLSTLFLFLTACRDPGIIPRQEPDEEYLAGRKPRTQEVMVNGHKVVIRYNDTCHFYQPPRAHHCSVNDNCIERFDHHCPWVGTTIGKRNYQTFLLFVYTATILCLYVIGVSLAQLFLKHKQLVNDATADQTDSRWGATFASVIPAVVLIAYCFIFMWFVGGLSAFHAYLVATNQTTYENFRYNHDERPNPFNRGILSNCAEVWCMRVPPSNINFRAYADAPDAVRRPEQIDVEFADPNNDDPPVSHSRVVMHTGGDPTANPTIQQPPVNRSPRSGSVAATGDGESAYAVSGMQQMASKPASGDGVTPMHTHDQGGQDDSPQATLPLPPLPHVAEAALLRKASSGKITEMGLPRIDSPDVVAAKVSVGVKQKSPPGVKSL